MSDPLGRTREVVTQLTEQVRRENPESWFDLTAWKLKALAALVALAVLLWLRKRIARALRRRRPPTIHPLLQKYGREFEEPSEELKAKRRTEAAKIVATSSTTDIAGYEIIEQVEAVYVDGFRRPEEALEGLKAVAAMKGANAVTHVQHERSASGKCSASGDAVVVRKLGSDRRPDNDRPDPLKGSKDIVPAEPPNLAGMTVADVEKLHIMNTLRMFGGNTEKTAKALGIGARTLYRKLRDYGLR